MDYSQVVYTGMHNKVKIICKDVNYEGKEYGEFWQEPAVHLKGCTHPQKAIDLNSEKMKYSTEDFISKAKKVHTKDDYDYSLVDYKTSKTKVKIVCNKVGTNGKIHGVFETSPDLFLMGKGCPKCGNHLSVAEDEICDFLKSKISDIKIVRRSHKLIDGEEVDIFLPEYKLGIEYDGNRWHSELFNKNSDYHLNKTNKCRDKGIILIHIFEDEWKKSRNIVLEKIENFLGRTKKPVVGGRNCSVKLINKNIARDFVNKFHIQGFVGCTIAYGAFKGDELVAVMTFINKGEWELNRFCTNTNYRCPGVASKLFTHFIREHNPDSVKSFLDRRWCFNEEENLYTKLGFVKDETLKPDYRYTNGHGERIHKFNFRKRVLHRKYGLPLTMTESEMAKELGCYKIWDCGLIRYVWKKEREE